jgi:hypothetical protein
MDESSSWLTKCWRCCAARAWRLPCGLSRKERPNVVELGHEIGGHAGQGDARQKAENGFHVRLGEIISRGREGQGDLHVDRGQHEHREPQQHPAFGRGLAVQFAEHVGGEDPGGVAHVARGGGQPKELQRLEHLDVAQDQVEDDQAVEPALRRSGAGRRPWTGRTGQSPATGFIGHVELRSDVLVGGRPPSRRWAGGMLIGVFGAGVKRAGGPGFEREPGRRCAKPGRFFIQFFQTRLPWVKYSVILICKQQIINFGRTPLYRPPGKPVENARRLTMKAQIDSSYKLFIGGQWVAARTAKPLPPATRPAARRWHLCGRKLRRRGRRGAGRVEGLRVVERTSPQERAAVLLRVADLIDANAGHLAMVVTLDNGKPIARPRPSTCPSPRTISATSPPPSAPRKAAR